MLTDEKAEIELKPFTLTGDSFPEIVVRKDIGRRWYDDDWAEGSQMSIQPLLYIS